MYCVRCKSKFQPHGGSKEMARNGVMMLKAPCPHCKGRCCQIIGRGAGASRGRKRGAVKRGQKGGFLQYLFG